MHEKEEELTNANSSEDVESWIFSLIPVGVAFACYVVFILQANLENKNLFMAYGATAGFIGLESYWILKGWRKKRTSIVVMGLIGIAITLGILFLYLSVVQN
jgi:apolipoprotein N-acyltransferase